jgi:hypothetical protein
MCERQEHLFDELPTRGSQIWIVHMLPQEVVRELDVIHALDGPLTNLQMVGVVASRQGLHERADGERARKGGWKEGRRAG